MSGPVASNSLVLNIGMRYPAEILTSAIIALGVITTPLPTVEDICPLPTLNKHIAG